MEDFKGVGNFNERILRALSANPQAFHLRTGFMQTKRALKSAGTVTSTTRAYSGIPSIINSIPLNINLII